MCLFIRFKSNHTQLTRNYFFVILFICKLLGNTVEIHSYIMLCVSELLLNYSEINDLLNCIEFKNNIDCRNNNFLFSNRLVFNQLFKKKKKRQNMINRNCTLTKAVGRI